MVRVTAKSSTIFIGTRDGTRVFRSVADVPPPLRARLERSTAGNHCATILIADKRGRQELVRALEGQPSPVDCRLTRAIHARQSRAAQKRKLRWLQAGNPRLWLEIVLSVALAIAIWLLLRFKP